MSFDNEFAFCPIENLVLFLKNHVLRGCELASSGPHLVVFKHFDNLFLLYYFSCSIIRGFGVLGFWGFGVLGFWGCG